MGFWKQRKIRGAQGPAASPESIKMLNFTAPENKVYIRKVL